MTNRERIVYLHGFASSPASKKAAFFRDRFREVGVEIEIPDLADPVTAAMKREGCLWEPDRIEKSLMLSLVPLYSGIYWIAFRRLLFPTCT